MDGMNGRRLLAATVVALSFVVGTLGAANAQAIDAAQPNCVGQHVSEIARTYGGMAAATAAHNEMHGTDLSVGEHLAHIRAECDL